MRVIVRCEDRRRALKDTALPNLPLHGYDQNRIWVEVVALAADLLTWMLTRPFDEYEPARRWEPKRTPLPPAGCRRPYQRQRPKKDGYDSCATALEPS